MNVMDVRRAVLLGSHVTSVLHTAISTVSVELLYRVVDPYLRTCCMYVCTYVACLFMLANMHPSPPLPSPPLHSPPLPSLDPAGQAREEEEAQMDYDSAMKEVLMHNPSGGAHTDTQTHTHTCTCVHTPPFLPT